MKSTVETLGPTRVRLDIEVPFAEVEPSLRKAYRAVAQQVNIPGFRRGKVPAAVIDQRIGRDTVIGEALQELIPQQLFAAINEHQVKAIGQPEMIGEVEANDGQPVKFAVELDVRPEIELPDLSSLAVTVDEVQVTEEAVDEQVTSLRERFATLKTVARPAATGDFVQLDLAATVDGKQVEGGTASNLSYEVGSDTLVAGLDEAVTGLSAGEETRFTTTLVGGDLAGRQADVAVTVRNVREKELPELDDEFAGMASEFDSLAELREDLAGRVRRSLRLRQVLSARDKVVEELVARADVPAPEGVVRDQAAHRKQHLSDELEQAGRSLQEYLDLEGKTEAEVDAELAEAAAQAVKMQMVLDALAEAEQVEVSEDDFRREVVMRAQQAGVEPQNYYDQLVRAGADRSLFSEVRRSKAMGLLLDRATVTDTAGNPVDFSPEEPPDAAAGGAGDGAAGESAVSETGAPAAAGGSTSG